jgi:hypothetical protein
MAQKVKPPDAMIVGDRRIDLTSAGDALSMVDLDTAGPGNPADINLPSVVLRRFALAVDYRARTVTLAPAGALEPRGSCSRATVDAEDGTVRVPAKVRDEERQVTLDIGASCSLIDPAVVRRAAVDAPSLVGAVGPANMWGTDDEATWEMAVLPPVQVAGADLGNLAVAAFGTPSDFESYVAGRGPSFGLIGGASLRGARISIDYRAGRVCVDAPPDPGRAHVESVGLVLRPQPDGRFTVAGIPRIGGEPCVASVQPGASLVSIDDRPTRGHTLGEVLEMLGGHEGDAHRLIVEQSSRTMEVVGKVRRLL